MTQLGPGAPPMDAPTLALLFVAAALGGALNSVAGGGSFIAFPALVFAGVPEVAANATNSVALWPAGVASAVAYRNDMPKGRALVTTLVVASFVGSTAGAALLLKTAESTFVQLIPWLLLMAAALFSFGPRLTARFRASSPADVGARGLAAIGLAQTVIALYGGYFGGGMGILMLAALSLVGMTNIHAMNALKTILGAVINGVAIALFIAAGAVAWRPGSVMIVGGIAGGYAGAWAARRMDPKRVRPFVAFVAWSMTAYFFLKAFRHG
jgi:uncharacterized membrane protein YfcA